MNRLHSDTQLLRLNSAPASLFRNGVRGGAASRLRNICLSNNPDANGFSRSEVHKSLRLRLAPHVNLLNRTKLAFPVQIETLVEDVERNGSEQQ